MQEEMETMKSELYQLHKQDNDTKNMEIEQLTDLYNEIREKNDIIENFEKTLKKAEDESTKAKQELRKLLDRNDEIENKYGDQDDQIGQMHEDMQRLLEFKNELEALIEEQNKDITVGFTNFNPFLLGKNRENQFSR